jgi:outer membrane protein, heavy metal efflux system
MEHPGRVRVRARKLCCALVIASLLAAAALPARAQHEGHTMPAPAKPAPRRAAKRKAPARPAARKRSTRRAASQRPAARPGPAAARPAEPAAADQHQGHTTAAPATQQQQEPAGGRQQQHQGHQMTPPQPQASPSPAQQPAQPAGQHQGHQTGPQQPTAGQQPGQPAGHDMSRMTQGAVEEIRRPRRQVIPEGPAVRLGDLEKMAVERNPTLAQSELVVRAAEGRRRQAGLFPNPIVGYFGEELSFRAAGQTSEHGFFVEQTIPLGGKLGKAQRVFARERDQAVILAEAQRTRVLNSIRVLYFDALGAQRLVELRDDLSQLSREAVEITKELYNVGQADRPDQLEIEIEAERAEVEFLRARTDWEQSWRVLAAMVGDPGLAPARLAGDPEEGLADLSEEQLLATLLRDSPEVRVAQAEVERARAVLSRARAERVPDLFVRGGVGYNNERLEADGRKIGPEGVIEVGVNVPIFNRNQGGIAAAEAELGIAERDLQRLQLLLRTRFASGFREYRNAQQVAGRYRTQIIPRARQAYQMYLSNFRQMAAAYPQVLIAQRTLFQVEVEYARSLVELRRSVVGLRGFLLSGGLDAVGRPGEAREAPEGSGITSASDVERHTEGSEPR